MEYQQIFDAHAHLPPGTEAVVRLLATMDDCGISRAIVVAGAVITLDRLSRQIIEGGHIETDANNDAVLAGCAQSDGRLVPFFFANPHNGAESYRKCGPAFRGLKLAPGVHGVPLNDERMVALVEVATELGHNVYLHCLHREGFGVRDLVRLADRFRSVSFVLGHAGVGDLDLHGVSLISPKENILFETSGGFTEVIKIALDRLGPERVLFGSEYPLQSPKVELTKFEVLDLPAEHWQLVAWENAANLAGGLR